MKLCAVTVWYNPNENILKNIYSYIDKVERIYIVDNSSEDNSKILPSSKKLSYIPLLKNTGIARALNIGCEKALADGFSWCMTMDQDSVWDSLQLEKYLNHIQENISKKNVSFAPTLKLNENYRSKVIEILRKITKDKLLQYYDAKNLPNAVITSGNVINLHSWEKINGFCEPFFIDEVDIDFCFRLKENGLNIMMFKDIHLEHELGNSRKTFLPKETHSPERVYYMIRNILYMQKMHPSLCKEEQYLKRYWLLLIKCFFSFDLKKFKMYKKAKEDFKNNKLGKLELGE